jgi:hypothetical protein
MKRNKGNPVIQAVAREAARVRLRSALINQKIAIYMAAKGEDCSDLMEGLHLTLAVIGFAHEWQHRKGTEADRSTPDIRVLRGGLSACASMIGRGYDPINTVAIDRALDAAERINKHLQPESVHVAWAALSPANNTQQ